jgi:endonuclease V-like protein UPF0215 family
LSAPELESLRIVGVEDGSFEAFQRKRLQHTLLCAVKMLGASIQEVLLRKIEVDGRDATEKLLEMLGVTGCDVIILGGVSFAGFNVIDAVRVHEVIRVPVIVFSGEKPDSESVREALRTHFVDWDERWAPIAVLGEVYSAVTMKSEPPVYFEVVGASPEWAETVLRHSAKLCRVPEPVRVAGMIARGLT